MCLHHYNIIPVASSHRTHTNFSLSLRRSISVSSSPISSSISRSLILPTQSKTNRTCFVSNCSADGKQNSIEELHRRSSPRPRSSRPPTAAATVDGGDILADSRLMESISSTLLTRPLMAAQWKGVRPSWSCKEERYESDLRSSLVVSRVTRQDLEDTYQPPFQSCVEEGRASCLMCAYNQVNGVPSYCDAVAVIYEYQRYSEAPEDAVADVIKAGVDMNCGTYFLQYTQLAIKQSKIQEDDIDRALLNLLSVQFRLGFFNREPGKGSFANLGPQDVCSAEHRKLALEAARQGIVLLKNDNKFLPLNQKLIASIAIIGPLANDSSQLGGDYAGVPCNSRSLFEGFWPYVSKTLYASGCSNIQCNSSDGFAEAVHVSRESDVVIVIAGLDLSQENEGHDRVSLLLPGRQMDLISAVSSANKAAIILILMGGGPIDVSFAKENPDIASILWIGYPGEAGGQAIAEVIFGKFNPESFTNVPMNDMSLRSNPSRGYPGRTYRFYTGDVVYEFGHGLSYSNYTCKFASLPDKVNLPTMTRVNKTADGIDYVDVDKITSCNLLRFQAVITVFNNEGMDGNHVVMLFTRLARRIRGAPRKTLIGFTRVLSKLLTTAETSIQVDPCKHFSIVDDNGTRILPLGKHIVMLEGRIDGKQNSIEELRRRSSPRLRSSRPPTAAAAVDGGDILADSRLMESISSTLLTRPLMAAQWKGVRPSWSYKEERYESDLRSSLVVSRVTRQDLEDTYQPPFQSCVEEGRASCLMRAYNQVNGVPSCAHRNLLQKARIEWGFQGYITTDCDAVAVIYEYQRYSEAPEDAVADVIKAGVDMNCGTYFLQYTQLAIKQSKIQEDDIDRALLNLLSVQFRLGFFNREPGKGSFANLGPQDVCSAEHRKLALEAARQGIVLLKNDNKFLPLNQKLIASIAIIGPLANDSSQLGGDYAGVPCNSRSLFEGFWPYVSKTLYASGCSNIQCNSSDGFAEAVHVSRESDVVIVIAGLDLSQENEGHDRVSLLLPGRQMDLISAVSSANKAAIILILMGGGPIDVSFAKENPDIASILWIGYPGEAGGQAIAEVIFGKFNPGKTGGRLPMTWYPESFTNVPMNDMSLRSNPSRGYPGRTYRFYTGDVVYEFGHGLSYSNYTCKFASLPDKVNLPTMTRVNKTADGIDYVDVDKITSCNLLRFQAVITVFNNEGMDGNHVVMLFTRLARRIRGAPRKTLIGFTRVLSKLLTTAETSIQVDPCKHFSIVDDNGTRILPLGKHIVMLEGLEHFVSEGYGSDQGSVESGRGRTVANPGAEARAKELVADQQIDSGLIQEVVPVMVVQPAVTSGGAPCVHSGERRDDHESPRKVRKMGMKCWNNLLCK
ncbi:unnamed protein product [Camellia sinensis]